MKDNDQKLLWETYQQLNEDLSREELMPVILKAWSNFKIKKTGHEELPETPIPERPIRSDKETRDTAYHNANLPMTPPGTDYSDEARKMQKNHDKLLADFYPILDQILDATNQEAWFQVLREIEQSQEIPKVDKYYIVDAMNQTWHNANPPGDDEIQPGDTGLGPLDKYPDSYI